MASARDSRRTMPAKARGRRPEGLAPRVLALRVGPEGLPALALALLAHLGDGFWMVLAEGSAAGDGGPARYALVKARGGTVLADGDEVFDDRAAALAAFERARGLGWALHATPGLAADLGAAGAVSEVDPAALGATAAGAGAAIALTRAVPASARAFKPSACGARCGGAGGAPGRLARPGRDPRPVRGRGAPARPRNRDTGPRRRGGGGRGGAGGGLPRRADRQPSLPAGLAHRAHRLRRALRRFRARRAQAGTRRATGAAGPLGPRGRACAGDRATGGGGASGALARGRGGGRRGLGGGAAGCRCCASSGRKRPPSWSCARRSTGPSARAARSSATPATPPAAGRCGSRFPAPLARLGPLAGGIAGLEITRVSRRGGGWRIDARPAAPERVSASRLRALGIDEDGNRQPPARAGAGNGEEVGNGG